MGGFQTKWNFPLCIGAIDGKHIVMLCPPISGSSYYNYKKNFSLVMLAMVDFNYQFTYSDICSSGRISDGGIFKACSLVKALKNNSIQVPPPT